MDADPVGRYRAEDARPTDGVVRATDGVVAGTPLMDADPVGRDRAEDARPTDLEGEQTCCGQQRPKAGLGLLRDFAWQRDELVLQYAIGRVVGCEIDGYRVVTHRITIPI